MWLSLPRELHHLEFKEAKKQFDQTKLFEYCVGIANEGGGKLVMGVSNAPPRRVVGTRAFENPQKIEGQILGKLGFRVDVEEVAHADGRILIFHIPSRPRGSAYHLDGTYLMRSGEQLLPMTEDRLRAIFDEGKPAWLTRTARDGCEASDVIELLDTQSYFELMQLGYPSTRENVLERLEKESLIVPTDGRWAISNLGAMLFAKRLADFGELARRAARVVVYDGVSKVRTRRDLPGTKGYAVGFENLVAFIESQTQANEVIEQALRREARMFPAIAIRELVANALIHQDFSVTGAQVMVEVYGDRIEISNPGGPAVETERFIDEYRSRNEEIADLMRRARICEEKGSGIDKVIEAAEFYQLPAPEFRADSVRTTAILFGPQSFDVMSRDDRVRACYQHSALKFVLRQRATNQTLRTRFGLPDERAETVSRILRDTMDAGLIKLEDSSGRSKKYAKYLPFWA